MTLDELMIERTPPRQHGALPWNWRTVDTWTGWLVARFAWLEGHTDWNRKV